MRKGRDHLFMRPVIFDVSLIGVAVYLCLLPLHNWDGDYEVPTKRQEIHDHRNRFVLGHVLQHIACNYDVVRF